MKKINLSSLNLVKDFMTIEDEVVNITFTNAELGRSFNRNTKEGIDELNSLKNDFNANEVIYLKQIHSDKVLTYYKNKENIKDNDGDAIITNEKGVIIGVFTADCVPIILADKNKGVGAAIHSGWRGTLNSITYKTVRKMIEEYNTNPNDITAYIGPHIRKCCYEISEDLKSTFLNAKNIDPDLLFNGRKLNLEACIVDDLKKAGVNENNINSLDLCTYCNENVKLHSYRKAKEVYGRMFAFMVLK